MISKLDDPIVARVFEAAGNRAALARHLGIRHRSALDLWRRIPPKYVIGVERYLDKKITRHEMRPDIYPLENSS